MQKVINYLIIGFFFLFPLFSLTITPDSYEYNKMMILVVAVLALLLLFSLKVAREKSITINKSSFLLPLFLLTVLVTASALIQSPNRIIAFTTPLGPTTWIAGFFLYFLIVHIAPPDKIFADRIRNFKAEKKQLNDDNNMDILIFTAVLISLYTIALFSGIFPKSSFTPAGSLLSTALFIATMTVYTILTIIAGGAKEGFPNGASLALSPTKWSDFEAKFGTPERQDPRKLDKTEFLYSLLPYLLSLFLMLIALVFLIIHLVSDQKPVVLPFLFGWQIFLEVIKNVKTLFLGIGPTNFITAFTLTKPIALNQTPFWNVIFTSSSSLFLTLATEAGVIAAYLYLVIFLKSLKLLITCHLSPVTFSLFFALLLQFLFPSSLPLFILTIILLAFGSPVKEVKKINLQQTGVLNYLFPLATGILTVIIFYFFGRAYLAEVFFKQSLDSELNQKLQPAYNFRQSAISLNPYIDRYQVAFSQISLTLSTFLSNKKDPTAEEKQAILKLMQQAIDYSRGAVSLYRTNILNWDNLSQTYLALVNFAGSSEFISSALEQRIMLDPFSPGGYLLAGRFYATNGKYEEAEKKFKTAVSLKPDLANAHYQLGLLLIKTKKYEDAYHQLQTTKALLTPGSDDVKKVDTRLSALSSLLPKEATAAAFPTPLSTTPQNLEENFIPAISPQL